MSIVKKGVFTIPLYHGTTSLFVDSIMQHGLGGENPLLKYKAKEFMNELYVLAEKQKWEDEEWIEFRTLLQPIVFQQTLENDLNFKHGETYITPSLELATKYAKENPFGCEYLTNLRTFVAFLASRNLKGFRELSIDQPVFKAWEAPNDPYVITLNKVEIKSVIPEADQNLAVHIEEIDKLLAVGLHGPHSFKLKKPITVDDLIVKKIGVWDAQAQNLTEE